MSTYEGKTVRVERPAVQLFERITSFDSLAERLAELPDDVRQKLGDVSFTSDTLRINTPQVGTLSFRIADKNPCSSVTFTTEQSPVPMKLIVRLEPTDLPDATNVTSMIDVDLPMMIRPLVGPKLKEAADMFGKFMVDLNK